MKWRIGHWILAALLAVSFVETTSAAEKATATKKAPVKKVKKAPKPQAAKKPADPKTPTATASPQNAAAKTDTAAPTPDATAAQKKTAVAATAAAGGANGSAPEVSPGTAADSLAITTVLAEELAATRDYRRDSSREQAWKLWGTTTRDPTSRAELELHGRRLARLKHVLRLAKAEGKTVTADRALQLLDLELLRHERAMNQKLPKTPSPGGAP